MQVVMKMKIIYCIFLVKFFNAPQCIGDCKLIALACGTLIGLVVVAVIVITLLINVLLLIKHAHTYSYIHTTIYCLCIF